MRDWISKEEKVSQTVINEVLIITAVIYAYEGRNTMVLTYQKLSSKLKLLIWKKVKKMFVLRYVNM